MSVIIKKYSVSLVRETSKKYELEGKKANSPEATMRILDEVFKLSTSPSEKFVLLALNVKLEVVGAFEVFQGTIDASVVSPRDIFQRLLLVNASSFIVAHNHPSGNPTPSEPDIVVTEKLRDASKIMNLAFLDHIIIGAGGEKWVSLMQKGYID